MKVLSIVAFGPVASNSNKSNEFYLKTLGLPLTQEPNNYLHTKDNPEFNKFAVMPLSLAAQICFGNNSWPEKSVIPSSRIEFEVENIEQASEELETFGYKLFVKNKDEWDKKSSWFLSSEGILTKLSSS